MSVRSRRVDLTQEFVFSAPHTLEREIETESSRRMHGHTYRVGVTISGEADPVSGMLLDGAFFRQHLDRVRGMLNQHMLNDVEGLGPSTVENLCIWIWGQLEEHLPDMSEVSIGRDSEMQTCRYRG